MTSISVTVKLILLVTILTKRISCEPLRRAANFGPAMPAETKLQNLTQSNSNLNIYNNVQQTTSETSRPNENLSQSISGLQISRSDSALSDDKNSKFVEFVTIETPKEESSPKRWTAESQAAPDGSPSSGVSSYFKINNLYNLISPMAALIPGTASSLQASIRTLANITMDLLPTFVLLSRAGTNLSDSVATDLPSVYAKLMSVFVHELPQISSSLPNSMLQLTNAVSALKSVTQDIPSAARQTSSEAVHNLPDQVRTLSTTIGTFQTLVLETLPKTVMMAADTTQTGVNVSRISNTFNSLANTAKELPANVEQLQAAVSAVFTTIQRLPPGTKLSDEVIQQLTTSMTRLPDIIKAVPGNVRALTFVIENLRNTVRRAPSDIKGTIGLLPVVGDKDPVEAMNRIKLREYFSDQSMDNKSESVALGKSIVDSYRAQKDRAGIDTMVKTIAGSLQTVLSMVQGDFANDAGALAPVRPLLQSVKSLLDVIDKIPIARQYLPRPSLEPILNLLNSLTATVNHNNQNNV